MRELQQQEGDNVQERGAAVDPVTTSLVDRDAICQPLCVAAPPRHIHLYVLASVRAGLAHLHPL